LAVETPLILDAARTIGVDEPNKSLHWIFTTVGWPGHTFMKLRVPRAKLKACPCFSTFLDMVKPNYWVRPSKITNLRITFRFEAADAHDLDLEDFH
jgi:hypothetical protein